MKINKCDIVYFAWGRNGFDRIYFYLIASGMINLTYQQFKLTDKTYNNNALAFA